MIWYYFNHLTSGLTQMKKDLILSVFRKHMKEVSTNDSSNQREQNQSIPKHAKKTDLNINWLYLEMEKSINIKRLRRNIACAHMS